MQEFWQKRWQEGRTGWDLGTWHPQLVKMEAFWPSKSPNSKILVPGCGAGHEAEFWRQKKYETTGFDFSMTAVEKANELYGAASNINFKTADALDLSSFSSEEFDLICDRAMLCAIEPETRMTYLKNSHAWLKKDGYFASILFTKRRVDPEKGPPFQFELNDFIEMTQGLFSLEDAEEYETDDIDVVERETRIMARKI